MQSCTWKNFEVPGKNLEMSENFLLKFEQTSQAFKKKIPKFINIILCLFLQILQWLLCLTTKVLCEGRRLSEENPDSLERNEEEVRQQNDYQRTLSTQSCGRRTMPEHQLIASFLGRVSLGNVRDGFKWIQRNA